jgi:hypothetical protein
MPLPQSTRGLNYFCNSIAAGGSKLTGDCFWAGAVTLVKIKIAPIIAIIKFSVILTMPKGALELPPTQAQLRAILSIYTALNTDIDPSTPTVVAAIPVAKGTIPDKNPNPIASSRKG